MATDPARDLQFLLDRQSILDCIYRYSRGLDRHDVDILSDAYHPDAVDNHGNLLSSAAPSVNRLQDYGFTISFNLPVFFWIKQNEDVKRANYNLEAARDDLDSIRNQTAAIVTTLYRNAQLAYQTAMLDRKLRELMREFNDPLPSAKIFTAPP